MHRRSKAESTVYSANRNFEHPRLFALMEMRMHCTCPAYCTRVTNVSGPSEFNLFKDIYDILLLLSTYNKYKHSIIRSKDY
jgi:hypothetical protein